MRLCCSLITHKIVRLILILHDRQLILCTDGDFFEFMEVFCFTVASLQVDFPAEFRICRVKVKTLRGLSESE